ncbi:MAG: hypothetical protein H6668_14855 [Ardenticatenaceae bacterium]|nr:hypothetical protein [Ardenticatenaceae bacterium]
MTLKHSLIEIEWPTFSEATPPAPATLAEFAGRIAATRQRMEQANLTHLVVYGDREHFANLTYLTGFDPRFEEALLIIGTQATPLLVVGNECEGYLPISPLYVAGQLRSELYQPFSLLNQPRNRSRQLAAILGDEGINGRSRVGCAGWKYFSEAEHPQAAHTLEIPAYIADTLRQLAGFDNVHNATSIFMNPRDGLRAICSPAEIAYFEYTNTLASDGMARMLHGLRPGMRDYEVAELIGWNGFPLSCHITFATGELPGLSGPTGRTIQRGEPMSSNLAYWGSNSCRAGWVAETAVDLPSAAQDYVENFAGIYFEVMAEWFGLMQIGMSGDTIARLIADKLPSDKFGITLNPGHLIHLDEWLSSPIYLGSDIPLQSGMVMQVDVIPVHPVYASTRVEDGLVLADATLRQTLAASYPDLYARCQQRRAFITDVLGIALPEEVLPLSNIPGIVPPFFLAPQRVFAMR